jgi:uncharacterized membrane protein
MSNKNTLIAREKQRAQARAAENDSFIARNYWLWVIIAFVAYPLASMLSAFTEGSNVWFRISATGAPTLLVVLVVGMLVILIEVLSYILGKGAIDDIQAGVFSRGPADIGMWAIKTVGFIAIMGFSVFLSVNGAPLLNEKLRKAYTPPEVSFVSIDSINAAYNAQILPHQENISRMQRTTWKGSITRDASRSINKSQALMAEIEARRTADLTAAQAENQRLRAEWLEETETNSSYAMGFAGLGELIKLFCLIFIGLYDQGLSEEAAILGGQGSSRSYSGSSAAPISFTAGANQHHPNYQAPPEPTPRSPIGASFMPWLGQPAQDPTATPETVEPDNVATRSYNDLSEEKVQVELSAWYNHYKQHRSQYKAVMSNAGYTEEGRQRKANEHQLHMQEALSRLQRYGHTVEETPKDHRTLLRLVKIA